jgi:hypothetical protein
MRKLLIAFFLTPFPLFVGAMSPVVVIEDHDARFRVEKHDDQRVMRRTICMYRPDAREEYSPGQMQVYLDRIDAETIHVELATHELPKGCTSFTVMIPMASAKQFHLQVLDSGSGQTRSFYNGPVDEVPEWKPPLKFSSYDAALGEATVLAPSRSIFQGQMEITGLLMVMRGKPGECLEACAYFLPDDSSTARLPRIVDEDIVPDPWPISRFKLGEARTLLQKSYSPRQVDAILGSALQVWSVDATLRLDKLQVHADCQIAEYEAEVVTLRFDKSAAVTLDEALPFPEC